MLDISDSIVDYLGREAKDDAEIDKVIAEVLAWRDQYKIDRERQALNEARAAVLKALGPYYKELMRLCGKPVKNSEEIEKYLRGVEQNMKENENYLTSFGRTIDKSKVIKPAAGENKSKKSDEEILKEFLNMFK